MVPRDTAHVGMRGHHRTTVTFKHLRHTLVGEVRNIRHNAVLRQRTHHCTAEIRKRAARFTAAAKLVFAHPGQRQKAHAVALEFGQTLKAPTQRRTVFHGKNGRAPALFKCVFRLLRCAALNDPLSVRGELRPKTGGLTAVRSISRVRARRVVLHEYGEHLRPSAQCPRLFQIDVRIRIRDAAALRQAGHRVTVQIKKVQLHSLLFYKVNAFSIQFSRGVPKRGTVTSTTSKRIKFSASSG